MIGAGAIKPALSRICNTAIICVPLWVNKPRAYYVQGWAGPSGCDFTLSSLLLLEMVDDERDHNIFRRVGFVDISACQGSRIVYITKIYWPLRERCHHRLESAERYRFGRVPDDYHDVVAVPDYLFLKRLLDPLAFATAGGRAKTAWNGPG